MKKILNKIKKVIIFSVEKIPMSLLIRVIVATIVAIVSLGILVNNTDINNLKTNEVLSLLISVASIIVAIIVTYIFSKLFAEKSERIQRKYEIDRLAYKITALRKIAFHINGMHDFWDYSKTKSLVDSKYKDLKYEHIRDESIEYNDLVKILEEIGETSGQAYLALKGLQNEEHTFNFFREFAPQNYSVNDIDRFKEYAGSFWYLLDRSDKTKVNFNRVNKHSMNFIDKLFFQITGRQINQSDYRSEIKDLFTYFDSEVFEKHRYLTVLNTRIFPPVFLSSLINMFLFVLIMVVAFISFVSNFSLIINYWITIYLSVSFISVTTDLISIIVISLKRELKVDDFYDV